MRADQSGLETAGEQTVHPDSVFQTSAGRRVYLKVHRCVWSGEYPENSRAAIEECLRAPVARAEIDISMLRDGDFLVAAHDFDFGQGAIFDAGGLFRETTRREAATLRLMWHGAPSAHRPPLFSDVVAMMMEIPAPTLIELDMMDREPLPWSRVEELAQLVQPIKNRVVFNGSDWNLRRLLTVDSSFWWGLIQRFIWTGCQRAPKQKSRSTLPRGAYGYLDRHPLAEQRLTPVDDYLAGSVRRHLAACTGGTRGTPAAPGL